MKQITSIIPCLLWGITAIGQTGNEYLEMANKAFAAGNKDKAKSLYEKAAALDNADAHYELAYKYVVSKELAISHFSAAAKQGHSEAMAELFDVLLFRSASLTTTNPELALEIYTEAKKANPALHFFDDEGKVMILQQCVEAGPFDAEAFINKYKISSKDTGDRMYSIWELATEASHNGRFGAANPRLVLQLVCRGGDVPAELMHAVYDTHQNWKDSVVKPFDPCDYAGSGAGLAYCSEKASEQAEKDNQIKLKKIENRLKNNAGLLLPQAYVDASNFIKAKAFKEEGSDGSGYIAWAYGSADTQKDSYIHLVEKIATGFHPTLLGTKDYDKELNSTYKSIIASLKKKPIKGGVFEITSEDIKKVQVLWLKYRDSSAKLFATINPSVTEQDWKNYLTKIRIKQLKAINGLRSVYNY